MARLTRGLGALVVLLLGVIGVPIALARLGGNPFPSSLSWSSLRVALLTPDDGTILVGLVAVVGWGAWLVFVASVLSELVGLLSRQRIHLELPGLAGPQRMVASLLLCVVALAWLPQVAQAPPADRSPPPRTEAPRAAPAVVTATPLVMEPAEADPVAPPMLAPSGPTAGDHVEHVVAVGDDLWSLAEHYYGEGRDWRKIAEANPKLLSGGPDRLTPGWRLVVPDVQAAPPDPQTPSVVVRRGDSLSSIAARELGSAERWSELYRLNRAQLSDPDELVPGIRLILPSSDASEPKPDAVREVATSQAPSPDPPVGRGAAPTEAGSPPPAEPAPSTPARTAPVPSPPVSSIPAPPAPVTPVAESEGDWVDVALPLAGVGGLLAAGLLAGLRARRRVQLQLRPVGRRLPQPAAPGPAVETALGRRQRPLSLRTLDRACRAIAAHCRRTDSSLPPLLYALISDDELELVLSRPCPDSPVGFTVRGRSWVLSQRDVGYLASVPGLAEAPRPWPCLVTLGRDDRERLVVGDLEAIGLLQLRAAQPESAEGVLAAMAVELSFSPWADEMFLTMVGGGARLPDALGKHNVSRSDDLDEVLGRLEQRAEAQRGHHPEAGLAQHRLDPDLADPWAPEVLLIDRPMNAAQRARLDAVVTAEPRVTLAAVVVAGADDPRSTWSLELDQPGAQPAALHPAELLLVPQQLDPPTVEAVLDLVEVTGSDLTSPAPWWADVAVPPGEPPDNVTFLGRRFGGWGSEDGETEGAGMRAKADADGGNGHPTLAMLGPVELTGAAGDPPPRAEKQCLEYCAWLLEHPGSTAQAMAAALIVAEGTRRSNMSRLRGWLGSDPDGRPYLPDAYTGRIRLDPSVSSDWQRLQIFTAGGVNRASTDALRAALGLVRGAPLADTAPLQWNWAEELRTDMISCVRDIGVELTNRALDQGDIDLARWAAARALAAAPGDELLLAARIRTEHLAGNAAETERLTLQLAAQARALGVDLDSGTVSLLQGVMEGRVRARMA